MRISSAFTFAEVLLSLFVLAVSMYLYSGLQFRSMRKVRQSTEEIERIFFIKKYLYQLYLKPPTKKTKQLKVMLESPELTITGDREEINKKKSALKDFFDDIEIVWTQGSWQTAPDTPTIKMISLVLKPQEEATKQ